MFVTLFRLCSVAKFNTLKANKSWWMLAQRSLKQRSLRKDVLKHLYQADLKACANIIVKLYFTLRCRKVCLSNRELVEPCAKIFEAKIFAQRHSQTSLASRIFKSLRKDVCEAL